MTFSFLHEDKTGMVTATGFATPVLQNADSVHFVSLDKVH